MIDSAEIRERYLKVLGMADVATEIAVDAPDALLRLTDKIHALLFTDRLDLITQVRQLAGGFRHACGFHWHRHPFPELCEPGRTM